MGIETIAEAFVRLRPDSGSFKEDVKHTVTTVGVTLAALGGTATKLSQDLIRSHDNLKRIVENSGHDWAKYATQVDAATKTEQKYGHSSKDTQDALAKLTLRLGDPQKALNNLHLVTEIAAVKNISLAESADLVGKALSGNTRILKQFGIDTKSVTQASSDLEKAQKAQVKAQEDLAKATEKLKDKEKILAASRKPISVAQEIALKNAREKVTESTAKLGEANKALTTAQKANTEAMKTGGDVATQLNNKVKGIAEDQSKTLEGRVKSFKVTIQNFIAEHSKIVGPVLTTTGTIIGAASNIVTVMDSAAAKSVFSWTAQAAVAVLKAPIIAAQWAIGYGVSMVKAGIDLGVMVAKAVAGWIAMAAEAVGRAAIIAAQWLIAFGADMATALAGFLSAVAEVVGGWALMAAEAAIDALAMAASWALAFAPFIAIGVLVGVVVFEIIKHWQTIKQWTSNIWDAIKNFFKRWWQDILAIMTGGLSVLVIYVIKHWHQILSGTRSVFNAVVGFIKGIPGRIIGIFSGAGSWLFNAGRNIIMGLVHGIESAFHFVQSKLSSLTSLLPSWKGPPEKDKKILYGAGQMVMKGFVAGANAQLVDVRKFFQGPATNAISIGAIPFKPGLPAPAASGGSTATATRGKGDFTHIGPIVQITGPVSIRSNEDITALARQINQGQAKALRGAGTQVSPI